MSISIVEYLLSRLSEMGVRHVFGVPGDFNLWFLEQTVRNGSINFVGCCNELNAAYAADGCSRIAGISALATTYGVGELASLSGVAGAYAERVEGSDCLICVGTRFTDVASGFFTHQLDPKSIIDLQPFGLRAGEDSFNAVRAEELLSGLLTKSLRPCPVSAIRRSRSLTHGKSSVDASFTHVTFWRHVGRFLQPGDVLVSDAGTSFFSSSSLNLPEGTTFIGQPIWGSLGYGLPAVLGTYLAAPARRHLLFLGDGAFQMTAQELSTILWRDLNPVIFLLNNDGYTIERLIYGADSSYNDINPWHYGRLPAAMDPRERAVIHCVRNEAELRWALQGATDSTKPHLIEIILPRLDAPDPLVRFAKRAAEFDFPQLLEEEIDQVS